MPGNAGLMIAKFSNLDTANNQSILDFVQKKNKLSHTWIRSF